MKTLAFALTGDISMNSRALKQFRAWIGMGFRIEAFGFENAAPTNFGDAVRWHIISKPKGGGISFFRKVHQQFAHETAKIKADVYHASDLYVLPAMAKARKKHDGNSKLSFDSRELYPYVAATAKRPWVSLYWHALSQRYLKQCDVVFTVNESIAERLQLLYGIPKPFVLYNVPEKQAVQPSDFLRKHLQIPIETCLILHQGKMQQSRGCALLINAMRSIQGAVLVFLGDGALEKALKQQVESLGLQNVYFVPPIPPNELLSITAGADIGVTLLEDTCLNHHFALPNKLFEYLSVQVPILASNLPEIAKVVEGFEVGKVVNPMREKDLVTTLQYMIDHPEFRKTCQENAHAVFDRYSWEKGVVALQF